MVGKHFLTMIWKKKPIDTKLIGMLKTLWFKNQSLNDDWNDSLTIV